MTYIAELALMNDGCPGCKSGRPTIPERELMGFPGTMLPRLSRCLNMNAWHGDAATIERLRADVQAQKGPSGGAPTLPAPEGRDRARKPGEPLEEEVLKGIREVLVTYGWTVHNFEQGYRLDRCPACQHQLGRGHATTRVPKGTADLLVTGHGFNFWIEVKRPGGGVRESQKAWHREIRAGGGKVYILRDPAAAVRLSALIFADQQLPPDGEFPATPTREK